MPKYMCSLILLHEYVHIYSLTLSLINSTFMNFNLLRLLRTLTVMVPPATLLIEVIDLYANVA